MKNGLLTLIISTTFGMVNAQNVDIPDVNFKAYLIENTAINTNADDEFKSVKQLPLATRYNVIIWKSMI